MNTEHDHPHPDYGPGNHPGPHEPSEPSWSDVIGGIWHRLNHPIPPNMTG